MPASAMPVEALIAIVGPDSVSVRESDLEAHSIDESHIAPHRPDVVVWPSSTEQVAAIVRLANEHEIPVVPWSGGSSLEGNPVPVRGGILLAMYRMDRILEIRENDLQVVVQPGIVYDALNAKLRRLGLFFPPAPGSAAVATIGGMVSNNSSGMRAVRYGVTRNYVLKLKVVLPSGDVIDVGSAAKKSTSGYDLVGLFIGSEGTLGVVTEITLRLLGLPEATASVVAGFGSLRDATQAVYESVRYGLEPSALEILDANTVRASNRQHNLGLRETPTLFVEFHGPRSGVEDQLAYLRQICDDNHCEGYDVSFDAEKREELWRARSEARDSIKFAHPGKAMISGDVCVPISRFGEVVEYTQEVSAEIGLPIYAFGHAGDGNIHTEVIADRGVPGELERAVAGSDAVVRRSLEVGGTIAGEHGIGVAKAEFMAAEHGPALALMRQIKALIDPKNIMNPGKIFLPA